MIVASLDPVGQTVSMVSIPRDMVDVPLPDGRSYRGKINGLVSYVRWHPKKFPGAKDGQSVLTAALGKLLGLKIDRWAQVNLGGFVYLVDSVGGVNVNVTDGFCDPGYKEYGIDGFNITPGRYHFDGEHALAYARVRKAAGENDFTRADRQQEVIAALRDRIVRAAFLEQPGQVHQVAGQDHPDQHQAVVHRGLDRHRVQGRPQRHLSRGDQESAGAGHATTSAAPSRCPTSRGSAPWRPGCSRLPACGQRGSTPCRRPGRVRRSGPPRRPRAGSRPPQANGEADPETAEGHAEADAEAHRNAQADTGAADSRSRADAGARALLRSSAGAQPPPGSR